MSELLNSEYKLTKDGVNLFLVVSYRDRDITVWAKEDHDYYDLEQTDPKYLRAVGELMVSASELADKLFSETENIEEETL